MRVSLFCAGVYVLAILSVILLSWRGVVVVFDVQSFKFRGICYFLDINITFEND